MIDPILSVKSWSKPTDCLCYDKCINNLAQIAQKLTPLFLINGGFPMMAVVHMQARLTALLVSPRLCILYPFFQIQANAPCQMPKGSPIWGFSNGLLNQAMTSGEALWHDIDQGKIVLSKFFAIERAQCDALAWAEGL